MNLKELKTASPCLDSSFVDDTALVSNVAIDSRNVGKGDVFVAFKGENTDGNLYAEAALKNGAACTVLTDREAYDSIRGNKILVKDPLEWLKSVGTYKLENYSGRKICITGSVGKTSTKELISSVLSTAADVYTAFGNYNNELGVAVSACNLDLDSEFAVFEFGTNSKGEIAALSDYVRPDVSVVTGIGHSHIGRFGSIEKLAEEKLSITSGMTGGTLWLAETCRKYEDMIEANGAEVCFYGHDMANDIILAEAARTENGFYFTAVYDGQPYCFMLRHMYDHFVFNSLASIGIGLDAGLGYEDVMTGIQAFTPVQGRGRILKINGVKVIDDTYNAGYESIMSALSNLQKYDDMNKYAVIGEMGEIEGFEDILYMKLYKAAKEIKNINFIFVGQGFSRYAQTENITVAKDKQDAVDMVCKIEEGIILLKASRAKRFEDFIKAIEKEKKRRAV